VGAARLHKEQIASALGKRGAGGREEGRGEEGRGGEGRGGREGGAASALGRKGASMETRRFTPEIT
jgi:hypothetical protein